MRIAAFARAVQPQSARDASQILRMAHISFCVNQRNPQPEQDEEADQPDMPVGDESWSNRPGDFDDRRGDRVKQAIDKISLLRFAGQQSDQALRK